MTENIVLRVPKNQLEQEVKDYIDSGWRPSHRMKEDEIVLFKSTGFGSLFVHFLLLVCTADLLFLLLIPNILYAFSSHETTKIHIKVQNEITSDIKASSSQLELKQQIIEN